MCSVGLKSRLQVGLYLRLNTLDSIRAKDFLPLEQQEREQQEKRDWISIKK